MTLRGKRWRAMAMGAAVAALLLAAGLTWQRLQLRDAVAESLPPRPNLSTAVPVLIDEIDTAERRARGWRPLDGLAKLARLYHANGFLAEARTCEEGLLRLDPSNPQWPYLLADILGGFGELDESVRLLRQSLALAPDYVPARVKLGETLLKLNEPAEAARAFGEALARDPANPHARLGLARRDLAARDWAAARERLQQLVAGAPKLGAAWAMLATVDDHLGDKAAAAADRAKENLSGGVAEMPDPWISALLDDCYDAYRLRIAADVWRNSEDSAKPLALLQRAVAIAPRDAPAHRQLGRFYVQLNRAAEARRHLERAAELDPTDADNWNYLIRLLNDMGDAPAAGRALATGLAHCPSSPGLHLEKGRRLAAAGDYEAAAAEFELTRRLRPEESNAYVELAQTYFRRGLLDEGMVEIRRALSVDPEQPIALVLLARYAISTGDEAAARGWIQRIRAQPKVPARDLQMVLDEYRRAFGREP